MTCETWMAKSLVCIIGRYIGLTHILAPVIIIDISVLEEGIILCWPYSSCIAKGASAMRPVEAE